MNLILLEDGEVSSKADVHLSGPRADHILRVLKLGPGRHVRIGIVNGGRGVGTVISADADTVHLRCAVRRTLPAVPRVDVLLAVPRPKVMRRLWAQLAALGVGRIILTNSARVERNYFDTHVLSPACYRPLLLEGLQQARDTRVPEVSIYRQLKILVEDQLDSLVGTSTRLVAEPAGGTRIDSVVGAGISERVLLAVGPEGGWNAFETRMLEAHGFHPVSMGSRSLRSDTACVALLALVHAALNGAP